MNLIPIEFLSFRRKKMGFQEFQNKLLSFSSKSRKNSDSVRIFEPTIDELRKIFDKFDANKDGKISREEYMAVVRGLRKPSSEMEVEKIFEAGDLNLDGWVDFEEFVEVYRTGGGVKVGEMERAFRVFDANGDGRISAEDLMEVLRRVGERWRLEDCRRMVRAVDVDGDGLINLNEFIRMMTQKP